MKQLLTILTNIEAKEIDFFETVIFLNIEERRKHKILFTRWKVVSSFHAFFGNEPGHYNLCYKLQIPWGWNLKNIRP